MLGPLRHGAGDPTYRIVGESHWRAMRTPTGPATLALTPQADDVVAAEAWGPGAEWALEQVPELLGAGDDASGFVPTDETISGLLARFGPPRFGRSGLVTEALFPAIVEQKVTGQEAFGGFANLVRRFGEPAPGPGADHGLYLQPSAEALRRIPSWDWLRLPVDPARSKPIVLAARVAPALERTSAVPAATAAARLRTIPGVGEWTAAETVQRSHGCPDAVSFGDYHVAKDMGWALTGAPWTDDDLRTYLEPYAGHRRRVVALIYRAAGHRPRHGPRMAPRTHLPR